jgi:hypothetical protein
MTEAKRAQRGHSDPAVSVRCRHGGVMQPGDRDAHSGWVPFNQPAPNTALGGADRAAKTRIRQSTHYGAMAPDPQARCQHVGHVPSAGDPAPINAAIPREMHRADGGGRRPPRRPVVGAWHTARSAKAVRRSRRFAITIDSRVSPIIVGQPPAAADRRASRRKCVAPHPQRPATAEAAISQRQSTRVARPAPRPAQQAELR